MDSPCIISVRSVSKVLTGKRWQIPRYLSSYRDYPTQPKAIKDAYEIEGKGKGIVAKRDIHVNGNIAAENPVFVMPVVTGWQRNMSKEEMFVILFERLKLEQREQALALANCKPNGVCGVHEGILRINGLSIELRRFQDPCLFRIQTTTDIVHRHAI